MFSSKSPIQQPAYTCGTHISIFELDDDSAFISTLNPSAAEFVPSFYAIDDDSEEARRGPCACIEPHTPTALVCAAVAHHVFGVARISEGAEAVHRIFSPLALVALWC